MSAYPYPYPGPQPNLNPQRNQSKERGWLRIDLVQHNIIEDAYEPVWRRVLGLDPNPNLNPNPN